MVKQTLLFAPCAYNLAETSRMIEIAKAIRAHSDTASAFNIRFISEGGDFEHLIEKNDFPVEKLKPQITEEKIARAYKIDKGEAIGSVFSTRECIEKIESELAFINKVKPVAIITGSYVTIPVTSRVAKVPLVWVVQSTWLEGFFKHGAGMTDHIRFTPLKWLVDFFIFQMINLWIRIGLLNSLNKAARHFGVPGFKTMFDYWQGDLNLVAEPNDFTNNPVPYGHQFVGPIVAQQDFPLPEEVTDISHNLPLVYFAMGSSGTPEIIRNILLSFKDRPYRVIAPIRSFLNKLPPFDIPDNVIVTDWLPAMRVNAIVDISVIHGGIGTVMTAAMSGKPIVGVAMQPEQSANLAAIVRKGCAISVPKSKDPSQKVQAAIEKLLNDEQAKSLARDYSVSLKSWNGPENTARILYETYASTK